MATAATVVSLSGEAFARSADGSMRRLSAGDKIQQGEVVITSAGAQVNLMTADGQTLAVGGQESMRFGPESAAGTAPSPAEAAVAGAAAPAVAAAPGEIDVAQLLEQEAAAAGLGAGGENGGNSFVRLLRITEELTPLSYEFPNPAEGEILPALGIEGLDVPSAGELEIALDEDDIQYQQGEDILYVSWFDEFSSDVGYPGGYYDNGNSDEAPGDDVPDPSPTTMVGKLNFSYGGDGPGDIAFNLPALALTSSGQTVHYWLSDDGHTLVGYIFEEGEIPSIDDVQLSAVGNGEDYIPYVKVIFSAEITDVADGEFAFTLYGPLDHPDTSTEDNLILPFGFTVTDATGDTAAGTLKVNVDDDSPIWIWQGHGEDGINAMVREEGMSTGEDGDYGDLSDGNRTEGSASVPPHSSDETSSYLRGSLANLVSFGADGPGEFSLLADTSALPTLYSQGEMVSYSVSGNTLTATAGSGEDARIVFTLTVNEDGSWYFDLDDQLDHVDDGTDSENFALVTGEDSSVDSIDFSSLIKVTDFDGDPLNGAPEGFFTIAVQDDIPVVNPQTQVGGTVEEEHVNLFGPDVDGFGNEDTSSNPDMDQDTWIKTMWGPIFDGSQTTDIAYGDLSPLVSVGADEPGHFSFKEGVADMLGALGLTSLGEELTYSVSDINVYGQPGQLVTATAHGDTIFTLGVLEDGHWLFNLEDQLDHAWGEDENIAALDFSGFIQYTDFDGDTVNFGEDQFIVNVIDDKPVQTGASSFGVVEEEHLQVPWNQGNEDTGPNYYGFNFPDADFPWHFNETTHQVSGDLWYTVSVGADENADHSRQGTFTLLDPDDVTMPNLTSKGVDVDYQIIGGDTLVATAGPRLVFTLHVAENGHWIFTLNDQIDHEAGGGENLAMLDFSSLIQFSDYDGDSIQLSGGTMIVKVIDDVPVLDEQAQQVGTVEEEQIIGVDGNGNEDTQPGADADWWYGYFHDVTTDVAYGNLSGLVKVGADEPGHFSFKDGAGQMIYSLGLKSLGESLSYDIDDINWMGVDGQVVTATAHGDTIFTLTVMEDGHWLFNLEDQLDHPSGNGENLATLDFSGFLQYTDFDGDSVGLGQSQFIVNVIDDTPVQTGQTSSGTVEEEQRQVVGAAPGNEDTVPNPQDADYPGHYNETTHVTSGDLWYTVSVGADENADHSRQGTFSLLQPGAAGVSLPVLASNGDPVVYNVTGNTLTATADGRDIFTLVLQSNGHWDFTLQGQIDHAPDLGENTATLDFSSLIQFADYDGDTLQLSGGTMTVKVIDDTPVTYGEDQGGDYITVEEESVPGIGGNDEDDGYSYYQTGTITDNVSWGADGFGKVTGLSDGKNSGVYDAKAGTYTIETSVYKMVVEEDGDYTFTLKDNLDHPAMEGTKYDDTENWAALLANGFTVSAQDYDGDPVAGGIKVNVGVVDDIPVAYDDKVTAVETGTATAQTFNLLLVLDISGSMSNSEVGQEVDALKAMLDQYALVAQGGAAGVDVQIVTFGTSSTLHHGEPVSIADAKTLLDWFKTNNDFNGDSTNYDAAIANATTAINSSYAGAGWPAATSGHANVVYFLSDGAPQSYYSLDDGEEANWEATLAAKGATAWSIGVGTSNDADDDLEDVAYPDANVLLVNDFTALLPTLIGTITPVTPIEGYVVNGGLGGNDLPGADGWGDPAVVSATYGLDTYSFTSNTDSHIFDLGDAGSVTMWGNGKYSYTPGVDVKDDVTAEVQYVVQDADGDETGATLYLTTTDRSEVSATDDDATATEGHWTLGSNMTASTTITVPGGWSGSAAEHDVPGQWAIDPYYGWGGDDSKTSTSFAISANAGHPATIEFDIHVQGYQSGDDVKVDLLRNGSVVQTTGFITASVNDVTFNVTKDGNYSLRVYGDDDSSNGDLKVWIDGVNYTSYTYTPEDSTKLEATTPSMTWVNGLAATGNVMSNDSPGSEGAKVTMVDATVIAAVGYTDVVGTYGTLSINAQGDYTYTPNPTDNPAGIQDVFSYKLEQPDGDSATANLTVSFTDFDYNPIPGGPGGNKFLGGEDANDTITGDGSNEVLYGGRGDDTLDGDGGGDLLVGGAGNDTLIGGALGDILTGGSGSDTFVWKAGNTGADFVTDFNLAPKASGGDVLDLSDLLSGEHANAASLDGYLSFGASDDGKTVITIDANAGGAGGTGQTIVLDNVQFSDLQAYAGGAGDDVAIITKLLSDGNLKTDA